MSNHTPEPWYSSGLSIRADYEDKNGRHSYYARPADGFSVFHGPFTTRRKAMIAVREGAAA